MARNWEGNHCPPDWKGQRTVDALFIPYGIPILMKFTMLVVTLYLAAALHMTHGVSLPEVGVDGQPQVYSVLRQVVGLNDDEDQIHRKGSGKRSLPSSFFKENVKKQCKLPESIGPVTLRVKCNCCERFCNCRSITDTLNGKRSRDSPEQKRRFIQSDIKRCRYDERRCGPKWSEAVCGTCDQPWFQITDDLSNLDEEHGNRGSTNPGRTRRKRNEIDTLSISSRPEQKAMIDISVKSYGFCFCNMP